MAQVKTKLGIDEWVEKYFDNEYSDEYYTWTFSDDGMHPQDKSTWFLEDLIEEIEFFKDCYNKDLSAYKALLFLIDYSDTRRNEK